MVNVVYQAQLLIAKHFQVGIFAIFKLRVNQKISFQIMSLFFASEILLAEPCLSASVVGLLRFWSKVNQSEIFGCFKIEITSFWKGTPKVLNFIHGYMAQSHYNETSFYNSVSVANVTQLKLLLFLESYRKLRFRKLSSELLSWTAAS